MARLAFSAPRRAGPRGSEAGAGVEKPAEQRHRQEAARASRGDGARHVPGADARDGVGERPRDRHRGVGEAGRGGEPVGRRHVEPHEPSDRRDGEPQAAQDDADEPEAGHHLRPPPRGPRADPGRQAERRQLEHQVRRRGALGRGRVADAPVRGRRMAGPAAAALLGRERADLREARDAADLATGAPGARGARAIRRRKADAQAGGAPGTAAIRAPRPSRKDAAPRGGGTRAAGRRGPPRRAGRRPGAGRYPCDPATMFAGSFRAAARGAGAARQPPRSFSGRPTPGSIGGKTPGTGSAPGSQSADSAASSSAS